MQNYNGQPNVGIKLMSKMGYGVAGELCSVVCGMLPYTTLCTPTS